MCTNWIDPTLDPARLIYAKECNWSPCCEKKPLATKVALNSLPLACRVWLAGEGEEEEHVWSAEHSTKQHFSDFLWQWHSGGMKHTHTKKHKHWLVVEKKEALRWFKEKKREMGIALDRKEEYGWFGGKKSSKAS